MTKRAKLDGGIQHLLYTVIVIEGLTTVEAVSGKLCCTPGTIYDYLERKPIVPLPLIKTVYELTGDPRVRRELEASGCRMVADFGEVRPEQALETDLGDIYIAASALHQAVREAESPKSEGGTHITLHEVELLERQYDRVMKELIDVEAHIRKLRLEAEERAEAEREAKIRLVKKAD